MKYLKDVLIKEVRGHDYVFIVSHLPKSLIFEEVEKMVSVPKGAIDYDRTEPKIVPAYILRDEDAPDEPRNRRQTHEKSDELLEGIELALNGDGGFVFHTEYNGAKDRLAAIDSYIQTAVKAVSALAQAPRRVKYSSQEGSFMAPPKPTHLIPRVELPEPVSPPASAVQATVQPETTKSVTQAPKKRREMTEEQKQKLREGAERMRAAKLAKKLQAAEKG